MIDSYTKVNARIGVSADNWEIMAYGRNITDEAALQQSFDTPVLAGSHTFYRTKVRCLAFVERSSSDIASRVIPRKTEEARQAPGFFFGGYLVRWYSVPTANSKRLSRHSV